MNSSLADPDPQIIQSSVRINHVQMPPNIPPKNPFASDTAFPKQKAPTLAELSKAKPAYEPINFKPVPPSPVKSPEEWHKLTVGTKRKAPDGTHIDVFNQHLYTNSV